MMRSLVAFAVSLVIASAALAEETPPPTEQPKKICRKETMPNSRIPVRTCQTQAEWNTKDAAKRSGDFGTSPLRNFSMVGQRGN
jgi:hypothetical protein